MEFTWESMASNLQDNAFGEKKGYDNEVDTRFWKLSRDENDNGAAIIRFLPDSNNIPFVNLTKINASRGGKSFYVSEWSPTTIGLKCPFNEKFTELWNKGDKTTAKLLGRSQRYVTNIKVIKDPANPSNEGKIFLFDMSQTMIDMLKGVMIQTESMKALDEEPIAVYNPLEGNNFLIKAKLGSNKLITYGDSKFSDKVTSIYESKEAAEKDILENTHSLKEFLDPSNFKSYEELSDLRDKFLKEGKYAQNAQNAQESSDEGSERSDSKEDEKSSEAKTDTPEEKPKETPKASKDVDDELDSLLSDME